MFNNGMSRFFSSYKSQHRSNILALFVQSYFFFLSYNTSHVLPTGLEALTVDNAGAGFVILLFTDPHLLEG